MITGIYPGCFDPLTEGHLDIIRRSKRFCDKLIIAIGINPTKKTLFSAEERLSQIDQVISTETLSADIKADYFDGLLVDYAKKKNATIIIRGIRSVSDFEYELNLANVNRVLLSNVETVFLPTSPELAVVSSSMVKEIAKHGGDISRFVPPCVAERLRAKIAAGIEGNLKNCHKALTP